MPEGDTIHAAAARVRATLGQGPIRAIEGSRIARQAARLVGGSIDAVWSHGKHLVVQSADWAIRTHLGMHGRWTTHAPARQPRIGGSLRVMIGTDAGVAACWSAPDVVVDRTPKMEEWLAANLGPDLIRSDPDADVVARATADPSRTIAEVLLDQRIAAGIGNVYKSELCFRAGIHPFTPVGSLDSSQVADIFTDAATLLRLNSHRSDRVTTSVDRPGQRQWVYGRPGRGCRRCNAPIQRGDHGNRVTFWCPNCQARPQ